MQPPLIIRIGTGIVKRVKAAKQLFGEKRLLLGTNATETAFRAEPLADFEIIHIAVT